MDDTTRQARLRRIQRTWRREFAGHNRGTRDLATLDALRSELEALGADGTPLPPGGDDLARHLDRERRQVTEARHGGTVEARVARYAGLANDQFRLYREHFAGKSRASRRTQRLATMVGALDTIRAHMRSLVASGETAATNTKNIGIVEEALGAWTRELDAVRSAQAELAPEAHAGALGGAANDVFAAYKEHFAGQDRATRDLALLGALCTQLSDLASEMEDLAERADVDTNASNLEIVRSRLAVYEDEYDAVADAQKPA